MCRHGDPLGITPAALGSQAQWCYACPIASCPKCVFVVYWVVEGMPWEVSMHTATVSTKGWVVIPKDLREKLGLKKGSQVQIVEYDRVLALVPLPDDPVEALHGLLAEGPSLTEDLLAERARERDREEDSHA